MNPTQPPRPIDNTPVTIDDAAELLGVRSTVLEELVRWGEIPSVTLDDQLAISRSTLDGLFDVGVGSGHDLELDL